MTQKQGYKYKDEKGKRKERRRREDDIKSTPKL